MTGNLSKLPKWAQERIRDLENRCKRLGDNIDTLKRISDGDDNGSGVVQLTGLVADLDHAVVLPDHARVRFKFGERTGDFIEVRLDGSEKSGERWVHIYSGDLLLIRPQSANTVDAHLEGHYKGHVVRWQEKLAEKAALSESN